MTRYHNKLEAGNEKPQILLQQTSSLFFKLVTPNGKKTPPGTDFCDFFLYLFLIEKMYKKYVFSKKKKEVCKKKVYLFRSHNCIGPFLEAFLFIWLHTVPAFTAYPFD